MVTQASIQPPATLTGRLWLIRALALCAAGISAYLLVVSFTTAGLPLGCGEGSGCSAVLTSRFGGVFGIPVSGPAILLYCAALVATVFLGPGTPDLRRARAWRVLLLIAACAAVAAAWFIVLQLAVLRAVCPWCMADHALGLAFAAVVWWSAPTGRGGRAWAAGLAALAMLGLVAGQLLIEYSPAALQRLPSGANVDTGPGPRRVLQLLDGDLVLRPHLDPLIGSPDATHVLAVLFDYCCPHCRSTHGYLLEAMDRFPDQLAFLALPMPRNRDCNPSIEETEPRFEHACELARLAMAVHRADRDAFPAFDRWLFEPETPRTPVAARRHAASLVGDDALTDALADDWVDEAVRRGVEAFATLDAERIPVILAAKMQTVVGRPEDAQELFDLLEAELGVQAVSP